MEFCAGKGILQNVSQKGRNQTPKNYLTIQICRGKPDKSVAYGSEGTDCITTQA